MCYKPKQSFTVLQTDITPVLYVATAAFWYPAEERHQMETALIYQGGDDEIEVLEKKIHGSFFDEDGFCPVLDYSKKCHKLICERVKRRVMGFSNASAA